MNCSVVIPPNNRLEIRDSQNLAKSGVGAHLKENATCRLCPSGHPNTPSPRSYFLWNFKRVVRTASHTVEILWERNVAGKDKPKRVLKDLKQSQGLGTNLQSAKCIGKNKERKKKKETSHCPLRLDKILPCNLLTWIWRRLAVWVRVTTSKEIANWPTAIPPSRNFCPTPTLTLCLWTYLWASTPSPS